LQHRYCFFFVDALDRSESQILTKLGRIDNVSDIHVEFHHLKREFVFVA
jgi:hypothetical protein